MTEREALELIAKTMVDYGPTLTEREVGILHIISAALGWKLEITDHRRIRRFLP